MEASPKRDDDDNGIVVNGGDGSISISGSISGTSVSSISDGGLGPFDVQAEASDGAAAARLDTSQITRGDSCAPDAADTDSVTDTSSKDGNNNKVEIIELLSDDDDEEEEIKDNVNISFDNSEPSEIVEPQRRIRKRRCRPNYNDDQPEYEQERFKQLRRDNTNRIEDHTIHLGTKIYKEFGGKYYTGTVYYQRKVKNRLAWHVHYEEDGDSEDLYPEEILPWIIKAHNGPTYDPLPPTPPDDNLNQKKRASSKFKTGNVKMIKDYQEAKQALCRKMGVTEEEVVAALNQMSSPYGLNEAMCLIHKAKDDPNSYKVTERKKFVPKVGLRVRKNFDGSTYYGTVTKDAEYKLVEDGTKALMWQVTFDDDDQEDMDFEELMICDASRPIRSHPVRGRQLCSLELFSGCSIVTQEFASRRWRVRSIDNSETSCATDNVDILQIQYDDIGMVPDFIWASPPCFTYSILAGDKHRSPTKGLYEKTTEAHQNNKYFVQMAYIMQWALKFNPHLIVVIENPVGLLQKMPLMDELIKLLGLQRTTVNYCALGRHDKKPTHLWTNDFDLRSTLSDFKCCQDKCPYYGGQHPIGIRSHGHRYNAAAIPRFLAEEVADNVHSSFYKRRIRWTKQVVLSEEQKQEFNKALAS